jgi:hypothetical protein
MDTSLNLKMDRSPSPATLACGKELAGHSVLGKEHVTSAPDVIVYARAILHRVFPIGLPIVCTVIQTRLIWKIGARTSNCGPREVKVTEFDANEEAAIEH